MPAAATAESGVLFDAHRAFAPSISLFDRSAAISPINASRFVFDFFPKYMSRSTMTVNDTTEQNSRMYIVNPPICIKSSKLFPSNMVPPKKCASFFASVYETLRDEESVTRFFSSG